MDVTKPKLVVIAGPTASGKTSLAIDLAENLNGEIVSADSIQIYRYMNIGSAKPTKEEQAAAKHHMIDIRNPDEDYSAGDYAADARKVINEIIGKNRVPLVVGGTGLYIRLLLGGVADIPPGDPEVRADLMDKENKDPGHLYKSLLSLDPGSAAELSPNNIRRIIRRLEIITISGKTYSELCKEHNFSDRPYKVLFLCLAPDKQILYERIDKRVDCMIQEGLLDEVEFLYERGYGPDLKSMQSLGYRHAGMIISGKASTLEAVALMKRDTRRYAKRQLTWFRSEPGVVWIDAPETKGLGLKVIHFLEN